MSTKKKEWEEEETAKQQQNANKSYISGYSSPYQQIAKDALDRWQNREDFTYDLNADVLYNQYKNNFMQQGKLAMKDAMGQASALTGGYGNSYAQTVGQQTYQGYLQQLNDIVPELYDAAYNRYLQEGNDLYNEWQVAQSLENQDYSRFMDKVAQDQWQQQFDADQAYRNRQSYGSSESSAATVAYDNGSISTEQIKEMQSSLGIEPTGYWDEVSYYAAGGRSANDAWLAYSNRDSYIDDDGNVVYATEWGGDKNFVSNYKAQTKTGNTDYNYQYASGMYTPTSLQFTAEEKKSIQSRVEKANYWYTTEGSTDMWDSLYNDMIMWKEQGYDVREVENKFPADYLQEKEEEEANK